MTLAARIFGVIRRPRVTFEALMDAPRWADVLIVTTLAAAAAGAIVMRTDIGQQALVDQWERTATAFGRPIDDAAYARLESASAQGPAYAAAMALVYGPLAAVALAGVIFAVGGRRTSDPSAPEIRFRQVLAVTAHAGVILALRQVVAAPATYLRETTASAATLGTLFPGFDEASAPARFLGAMDLFVVWWVIVLAAGVTVLYRRRFTRVASMLVGTYVAIALLLTVAMLGMGGS